MGQCRRDGKFDGRETQIRMVVNSLNFLLFFVVVFIVYYLPVSRKLLKFQNLWLFLTSYFFYGFADWKMILLLLGATSVFYGLGWWLKKEMNQQNKVAASRITTLGVILGIGILLYFKYLNFFADSFAQLLRAIGLNVSWTTLNIVLPIGVSFFTFKLISYVIEIHREHIEPCENFIDFGTYIAFFPTILSGPIDRPNSFLPQLGGARIFKYDLAVDGCRQILWGMFTKMCIADNLATVTDSAWATYTEQSGSTLLVVALLYFVQMYADFDGYSNMAIGVSKILGFNITRNFNHPLLARNTAEYWRRWHMSLTSWITDYIFMPLNIAFRERGSLGVIFACIINLVVIGLWHGANWTYGVFGLYHGLLFIPLVYLGSFGKKKKLKPGIYGLPQLNDFFKMLFTFLLVSFGLILFRAPDVSCALSFIGIVLSSSLISAPSLLLPKIIILSIPLLILCEWLFRDKEHPLQDVHMRMPIRWSLYLILIIVILYFKGEQTAFIYTQF